MNKFKKIIAAVAAASLCCGMTTGCTFGSGTSKVMTADDTEVTAGVYLYYAYSAYSQATSFLSGKDSDLDTTDKKALKKLTIDGKGTEEWIKDKAEELCKKYIAIEKKFDELDLELSADDEASIDSYTENYMSYYGDSIKKAGVSEESIKAVLTSNYESMEVFKYYYGVDGEEGVQESDLYDYYVENNARVRLLTFNKQDGSGEALEGDDLSDFEDMIEDYYDRIDKAKTEDEKESVMDEVESEYEEYSSEQADLATAETDEDGNVVTEETTDEDTTVEDTTDTTEEESTEEVTEASEEESVSEDESADDTTVEDSSEDEDTTEEDTSDEEDTTEDETSDEEETTTTTSPYEDETVIAKSTTTTDIEGNEPDEDDISYSPSQSVQEALFDTDSDDYIENGGLKLINDDETEYIILRRDIEERMTDDDLWTEDAIEEVSSEIHNEEYQDQLSEWAETYNIKVNNRAIKRYDVFEIDLYGQDSSSSN